MGVLEVMFPDGSLGVVYDLFGIIYGPVVVSPMLCCFVNIYQIVSSYVDRGAIPPFFFSLFLPFSLYLHTCPFRIPIPDSPSFWVCPRDIFQTNVQYSL